MSKLLRALVAVSALAAAPAFAATDGNLDTSSSQGTVDFTTVIPQMVRISGLTDMTLNVTPAALQNKYFSRQDAESQFCVYSNVGADGGYTMKVDGDAGKDHPFRLTGPSTLDYNVWVSDDVSNSFKNYTWPGNVVTGYKTTSGGKARPTDLNCSGGKDALVHVGVDNKDIFAAVAGTYKGTLKITVAVN
ncbi:hypothetical protein [Sphingomonas sp. PR090111-T3T-6A]|uniref:hypothetical protein n=1 Tax=Sphingomonas sp. PR090111-T3T-6A TaxID=685778 RepID=UPI00035D0265|nr:hypothetical protein [Sphingomonas sp. PR090111-T3T-6A]